MLNDQETGKPEEHLLGVLRTLYRRRKYIVYTCVITGIGAAVISLLLPVYYQAGTVFLSASPDQANPGVLFGESAAQLNYYGSSGDTERLLTLAESNELLDFLVDSFDLYEHYRIDPEHPKAPFLIKRKLRGLYEVLKTKRDAIELRVEDRDPLLAAALANAARDKIAQMALELIRSAQVKAVNTFGTDIQGKEDQLDALADSLQTFRQKYGIYNLTAQSENLTLLYTRSMSELARNRSKLDFLKSSPQIPVDTIAYLSATVVGIEKEVETIKEEMDRFNQGVYKMNFYERQYYDINETLSELKLKLKQYESILQADAPALILVEAAETPIVKSRPRRSLLVVMAVFIAFFMSILGVLVLDAYRRVDWSKVLHE